MTPYNLDIPVFIICPEIKLKDKWLERLKERYERTGLEKDKRSLERAQKHFKDDITELCHHSPFKVCKIVKMDYDLMEFVDSLKIYLL